NHEYLGVGPGAHSWFGGHRYVDALSPVQWASRIEAGHSPVVSAEPIPFELQLGETVMLGLRLNEGIDLDDLARRFEMDVRGYFGIPIRETLAMGLVEWQEGRLRLTRRARLL